MHGSDALGIEKTRRASARALSLKACASSTRKTHAKLRNGAVNHRQGKRSLRAHPMDQEHRVLEEFI
jgi:hypothetical protein